MIKSTVASFVRKLIARLIDLEFDGRMVARSRVSIQVIQIIILQMPNKLYE